jgi:type II secretory pathway pseudopilin PulG
MVLWPAVALVGFLVLTGLVIAMGASTTARYEREQQAARAATAATAGETVRAARAA